MAASTASHRPIKGILKNKSSTTSTVVSSAEQADRSGPEERSKPAPTLEAINILAPYPPGPADDYGPAGPQQPGASDDDAGSEPESSAAGTTAALWAQKLAAAKGSEIKFRVQELESSGDEDSSDLSPEEREKKRQFEIKRKLHYNEGLNIKLARELISKDLNEDEEDSGEEEEDEEEGEEGEEGRRVSVKTAAGNVRKDESSHGSASAHPKSPSS